MRSSFIISAVAIGLSAVFPTLGSELLARPSEVVEPFSTHSNEAGNALSDPLIDTTREKLEVLVENQQALERVQTQWRKLDQAWIGLCRTIIGTSRERTSEATLDPSHSPETPPLDFFAPIAPQLKDWPPLPNARLPSGRAYKRIPRSFLRESIPLPYRLAEWFGEGTNRVHILPSYKGAHILNDDFNGHEIQSRLVIEFFGTFTDHSTSTTVETFRSRAASAALTQSAIVRLSEDVKPHHRSIAEVPAESSLLQSSATRHRWFLELMEGYPNEARPVALAPKEVSRESELRKSIIERNAKHQKESRRRWIEALRSLIESTRAHLQFQSHSKALAVQAHSTSSKPESHSSSDSEGIPYEEIILSRDEGARIPLRFRILHLRALANIVPDTKRAEAESLIQIVTRTVLGVSTP